MTGPLLYVAAALVTFVLTARAYGRTLRRVGPLTSADYWVTAVGAVVFAAVWPITAAVLLAYLAVRFILRGLS